MNFVTLMTAAVTISFVSCGFKQVNTGFRGIQTEFGKVVGEPLPEGLHFYNPISSSIVEFEVREQKLEHMTPAFTRDTQNVNITFAMTYYPDPLRVNEIYRQFGWDWDKKMVMPATLGSVKDVVGKYIADDLVGKREEAKLAVFKQLVDSLKTRDIVVTRIDFTNLDFDDGYEKAVEAKVIAVQKASESKNKTVEVEEQAKQKVIAAEAEAKSMRIRSQALQANKGLVDYEAVQKWDGKLPQYMMGNSVPFVNLK
jgi:prohibitin 2